MKSRLNHKNDYWYRYAVSVNQSGLGSSPLSTGVKTYYITIGPLDHELLVSNVSRNAMDCIRPDSLCMYMDG